MRQERIQGTYLKTIRKLCDRTVDTRKVFTDLHEGKLLWGYRSVHLTELGRRSTKLARLYFNNCDCSCCSR